MIRKFRKLIKRSSEKNYELQSPQAETTAQEQAADKKPSRQIAVTRSYSVKDSRTGKSSADSMDELFASDAGWNGGR